MIGAHVLILGAMKSGTTTLFDLLARHPAIAPCRLKEAGFFAFEEVWAQGFDWYDALHDFDPARHAYALEASTDQAKHPFVTGVADRLAASAPRRFKLIYLMRHPLRRIESHARHVQWQRREVGRCISPRRDHSLDAGVSPVALAASRYAHQIDQYADQWQAGDLLLLQSEDLAADQAGTLARVFDFLGLEDDPALHAPLRSNPAARRSRHPSRLWLRLSGLGPVSAAIKAATPAALRRRLRDRSRPPRQVTGRFRLTAEEEATLLETLAPDLARLERRYGVDLARNWGLSGIR